MFLPALRRQWEWAGGDKQGCLMGWHPCLNSPVQGVTTVNVEKRWILNFLSRNRTCSGLFYSSRSQFLPEVWLPPNTPVNPYLD